jgi:hypothetical protein
VSDPVFQPNLILDVTINTQTVDVTINSQTVSPIINPTGITILNSSNQIYQQFAATNGQSIFTLNQLSSTPSLSTVYRNGVKQVFGSDYNINSLNLNWLGFRLSAGEIIEIYYL